MPLFKGRPAWAATSAQKASPAAKEGANQDDFDLFDKSRQAQAQLDREEAEARRRKEQKKEHREEHDTERPVKKRRVSNEEHDQPVSEIKAASVEDGNHNTTPTSGRVGTPSSKKHATTPSRSNRIVIDVDDEPPKPRTRSNKAPPSPIAEGRTDDENDLDEQIRRLADQARARQLREQVEAQRPAEIPKSPAQYEGSFTLVASPSKSNSQLNTSFQSNTSQLLTPDSPAKEQQEEVVISIFVHSTMPNTVPLILKRGLKQDLREVRRAWCERQGFSEDVSRSVSLYWRGNRVFDSASCSTLGIFASSDGNIYIKTPKGRQVFEERRIAMAAKTKEMHEEDMKRLEAGTSEVPNSNENNAGEKTGEEEPAKAKGIKIILRALGYDNYKVIVKPTTLVSKITTVFARERKVPSDKEVYVVFDGDRIDGSDTVESLDLEDWDVLELTVK